MGLLTGALPDFPWDTLTPYVDLDLALATASGLGSSQVWVTTEHLHDGLRVAGDVILPRLADLTAGRWAVTAR